MGTNGQKTSKKSFIDKLQEQMERFIIPVAQKIGDQRHLASVRDGMTVLVPITIIGGIFCLLAVPPVDLNKIKGTNFFYQFLIAWKHFADAHNATLITPYNLTIGIISIYVVAGIAYRLAAYYKMNTITNVIGSIFIFLLIAAPPQSYKVGETVVSAMPTSQLGAGAMFAAIITAIIVVEIGHFCVKKNIVIKLPASVPPNVAAPFTALIPMTISLLLFIGGNALCNSLTGAGLTQLIFKVFQPLISATGSLPSIILINVLMTMFWFFGIHGGNMVGVVVTPITTMNLALNAQAYAAGKPLPAIFAGSVNSVFGGWISYTAMAIVILIGCKAASLRSVSKVALVPSMFNINEPLIFGIPTVLNPFTVVGFLICNNVNFTIAYILMSTGVIGKFFITLPFTVPGPIAAFLATMDIKATILWFALLLLDIIILLPILKAYDKNVMKKEEKELVEV
ncbi:PTS sugar transporter subunit IIC [Clostridium folliculivorans]|uniref:PTS sugar transporter subunit IIC n=1 Tax=Clostridium folliculivorans TaxID=2886038 RepID=UPI0021C265C5|nr:PTS transporter subunit EIIC [Clostridium folliculivorans]GKU30460.1 permease IIC component [Clostridium folliculivorans]